MDKRELDHRITDVSKVILSYCVSRTPTRFEAEDLAQDIILETYKSAPNLRNDRAFYGFMWGVAGNVYKQWCKNRNSKKECELTEQLQDTSVFSDDGDDDINALRRELALLSQKYRKATIMYYIEGKSCSQISKLLSVSESMVKYLLFKSRLILKEGMIMERNYGEQSYNPKGLKILFWGNGANRYSQLCKSKISQNILFACYNDKLSAEEISLEIGVAAPYIEDNINELTEYGLLKKDGNRYFTNIVIFTKDLTAEVNQKTLSIRNDIADSIEKEISAKENAIRAIGFIGADMNNNSFLWNITCFLLYQAVIVKLQSRIDIVYPEDKFGTQCFVWGSEIFEGDIWNSPFGFGISNMSNKDGDYIQFMDFPINGDMVHHYFFNRQDAANIFLDIAGDRTNAFSENDKACAAEMIKKGYVRSDNRCLAVNAPVFKKEQFEDLLNILDSAAELIASKAESMMTAVTNIMKNHIPVHLKKYAKDMAYLRLFEDAVSAPVQILFERKFLLPYNGAGTLPTTYIILK